MRLLLDEMWPPSIAEALRRMGHDAIAVAERPDVRGQPDEAIFASATNEGRAIVTENVADYRPLGSAALRAARPHPVLLFTSNRGFSRGCDQTARRLIAALDRLLRSDDEIVGEYWLRRTVG